MGLRPTHLGYAYQDLLTALCLVDLMLGQATTVVVDTKAFKGDLFDDVTSERGSGGRQRLQIKHTTHERQLTSGSFTGDRRGLQLDEIITSIDKDLHDHPGTSYRIVLRDKEPQEPDLTAVLMPVDPGADPGPVLYGLTSTRMRFDAEALLATDPWRSTLADIDHDVVRRACDVLVVDVGLPACSLDIRSPGPAEQALLRRVADELGAGRPPNRHRTPEDVALSLIEAAKAARSINGTVSARDLAPRLNLAVDFGAVHEGHPVDPTVAIARPSVLDMVVTAVDQVAQEGGVVVVTGAPGAGKSWLCEQLADRLGDEDWLVARHHCWLGATDAQREQRVLTEVVIGSLIRQLETLAPAAVAEVRPRFSASRETLAAAVAAVRNASPDRPVILMVDGLDHVTRILGRTSAAAFRAPEDPARLLVGELAELELPAGVVLLLASQPGEHLTPINGTRLTVPPLNHGETRHLAERLGLLAAFGPAHDGREDVGRMDAAVDLVYARSRGNALYATYLCRQAIGPAPGLDGGLPQTASTVDPLDRLRAVPVTADHLDDYYRYLMLGLTDGERAAVSLLAVCDFAVTPDEIREIFPQFALVPSALSTVAPIVTQQPGVGGLRIHHESFSRFLRAEADATGVAEVRAAAAAWLMGRGFFEDARAFRHLPELLVDLDRDDDLIALIGPDFLSRAIAGLQPPTAITHVLDLAARRGAARRDWPALARLVELRGAADTYETDGIPDTIVEYADVLVGLLGPEAVAATLLYEGVPTVPARWGLQLCAAVDVAGAAAPWDTYLTAWEETQDHDNVHYGRDSDHDLHLAVQRGRLRLPGRMDDEQDTDDAAEVRQEGIAERLANHLAQDDMPPLPRLLDVLIDGLGTAALLDAARLIDDSTRRAEVLLHLADVAAAGQHDLPSPLALATEAWDCSPGTDPLRMLRHGVPASDLAATVLGSDIDATLRDATAEVLRESSVDRPAVVRRWLEQVKVAREIDPQAPTRLLPDLEGVGFYRAWLRFTVTTAGLRRDLDAGTIRPDAASAAVRVALDQLSESAQPFTGRPRASDLWSIHGPMHEVLEDAVALLTDADLEPALVSLTAISDGTTTTTNLGTNPSGPLITTDLLAMLSRTVDRTGASVVHRLTDQMRRTEVAGGTYYPQLAAFELEMARISLTAGDRDEALQCWQRASHYMACYGSHKDGTIYELLNPLSDLTAADPEQGRRRLARVRHLTYLVRHHTNGRGTSQTPIDWWRHLADLDPEAAAVLAAEALLSEPGLEDARADAAHRQLVSGQATDADPVILAALRVAAGPGGRDIDGDVALLDRLHALPTDDPARAAGVLPLLANAITATYDDQPLMHASEAEGPEPTAALRDAAHRLGGHGPSPAPRMTRTTRRSHWDSPVRPGLSQVLQADQRPLLPPGAPGAVDAIRDRANKPYNDDSAAPRWAADALVNAVGWRLLEVAVDDGQEAAIRLLHRITEEFGALADTSVLAEIAAGLELRRELAPDPLDRLASAAYAVAFTKIRGGGGWLTFAGRDRPDLWRRAVELDADMAATILAEQVVSTVEGSRYATRGVTQALVAAFAVQSPDPAHPGPGSAFACWDAAFQVIAHRLPGSTPYDDAETCEPATAPATRSTTDVALARLALAVVAMPTRADRRRALVAASVLFAARPAVAQTAIAHVLGADLGAGPLTWLLAVVRDGLRDASLTDNLAAQLTVLARSDLLSVRALAAEILERAGRPVPAPPASEAHPILQRSVAEALAERPR